MAKEKSTKPRIDRRSQIVTEMENRKQEVIDFIASLDINQNEGQFAIRTLANAANAVKYSDDFTKIIHVQISSESDIATKAAFIAQNIDGVIATAQNSVNNLMTKGNIDDAIAKLTTHKDLISKLTDSIESLNNILNQQLSEGIGTRRQLERYRRDKALGSVELIANMIKDGKTKNEIIEHFKIDNASFTAAQAEVEKKIIQDSISTIEESLKNGSRFSEIAEKLGVNLQRLISSARALGLKEIAIQKSEAPKTEDNSDKKTANKQPKEKAVA